MPGRTLRLLFVMALALLTSACVTLNDPEASQEYRGDVVAAIGPGQDAGQVFRSRRPGLNGVHLWLSLGASAAPGGALSVELFRSPGEQAPLATVSVPFKEISENSPVKISLPLQPGPPDQSYYLKMSTTDGQVQALGRLEDAYTGGQAYQSGAPLDADFAFRLTYDYGISALLSDLALALSNLWLLLPLAVVVWLPGHFLLSLAGLGRRFDGGERFALSVGLSLALIPVLMAWTSLAGLRWSAVAVWAAALLMAFGLLWRSRARLTAGLPLALPRPSLAGLALVAVVLFSFAVRLIMVRDLAAPAWVDSVHHALITRLIVEKGAFPSSYAPYLEIGTASYHAGFHSLVASFHWLSGLDIPTAMLLLGQALNALAVVSVYLFTTTFVENRAAGVVAAAIAGLFTPMPAYYTSWGRYTQLAGVVILPVAAVLIKRLMDEKRSGGGQPASGRNTWPHLVGAAIASAGLFLTHYRVIAFLASLLVVYYLLILLASVRRWPGWCQHARSAGLACAAGLMAAGLALPWLAPMLVTFLLPRISSWSSVQAAWFGDFSWQYLNAAFGRVALVLAGLGALWGLIQRRLFPILMVLWAGLMFLLANLAALRLPGAGFLNNTSVEITLFMPIAALGGYFVAWWAAFLHGLLPERARRPYCWGLGLAGLALALAAARALLPILNPVTFLFRQADRPALAWIEKNVPESETILINPFFWGYGLYAGNDGGYWIAPLAGRRTLPPPVLYGLEDNGEAILRIVDISRKATDLRSNPQGLHDYMLSQGIHYLYIGARGGPFSPRLLQESSLFKTLYEGDGTWLFQTDP